MTDKELESLRQIQSKIQKDWVFDWIWPSFHTMTGLGLPSFTQLDWVDWAVTGYQGQCPALDWVDWVPSLTGHDD